MPPGSIRRSFWVTDTMPVAVVTRPVEDARALTAGLEASGFEVIAAPMLTIEPIDGPAPDLTDVQAIAFTSANGVRAFARRSPERARAVHAVGAATAEAARAAGFATIETAGGDVVRLAEAIRARCDPAAGAIYHGAGETLAGDLAGTLQTFGFTVRRDALYRARPATALPAPLKNFLVLGQFAILTLYSPRTVRTAIKLIRQAALERYAKQWAAACLSPAVAHAAREVDWARMGIADESSDQAMIALANQLAGA